MSGEYNTQCYPDKFSDREIQEMVVECEFKDNGCQWRHRIKDLDVSMLLDWFSGTSYPELNDVQRGIYA